ncbi:hypothetical protein NSA45_15055 [Paraclostridium bifermentans]|uniref:hypothetical protein n=1 Tax=Paraclostridium bifermentans TaxID=1490 RepID=UPI00214A70CF|nr:hypothetical protein [Paraclostridium bifermentans]MCR1877183.1 hypothetical protein [Paraclostridium bifermentans]
MITVLSILMIVLGFLLVVATVKERYDKKCGDGYNKTYFFINLVKGFYFLIIGALVILNIVSERRFLILTTLFCVFNMFIEFKNKNQANR